MTSKHEFKFCSVKDTEVLGLGDMQVAGKSLFRVEVTSPEAELFHLDSVIFKKFFEEEARIRTNCKNFVRLKKRFVIDRLGRIKVSKFGFFDKFTLGKTKPKKQVQPKVEPVKVLEEIVIPKKKIFPVFKYEIKGRIAEKMLLSKMNKVQATFYHASKIDSILDDKEAIDYYLRHFERPEGAQKPKIVEFTPIKKKKIDKLNRTVEKKHKKGVIDLLSHEKFNDGFNSSVAFPELNFRKTKVDLLVGEKNNPLLIESGKKQFKSSRVGSYGDRGRGNNVFRDRQRILNMQSKRMRSSGKN